MPSPIDPAPPPDAAPPAGAVLAAANEAVSDEMRAQIIETLDAVAVEENVLILHAAESGSRAWGFHSDDSDYDVRFLYARPINWHLAVHPGRDVIERPISDALDLGGWELRKALGLALGSNAVVSEWLRSPYVYGGASGFAEQMRGFCEQALNWRSVSWHYRRLAERQRAHLRDAEGRVQLKRYFYVIRPALALRWLRLHTEQGACAAQPATPPMDLQTLLAETAPDSTVVSLIEDLVARKRTAGEMGVADDTHAPADALIDAELAAAAERFEAAERELNPDLVAEADALHARWTRAAETALKNG